MSKLILITCLLSSAFSFSSNGQAKVVRGVVVDDSTGHPLSYVNIGIPEKNVGTTSNKKGIFSISIPTTLLNDSLKFSMVGYESRAFNINEISDTDMKIRLAERVTKLEDVVIKASGLKKKKIGNKSYSPLLWGRIESLGNSDILEFGQLIKLENKPSQLISSHLYIRGSGGLDSTLLRVNIYDFKDNKPGDKIVHKEMMYTIYPAKGWIDFDLEKYNIFLQEDFFISYEFFIYEFITTLERNDFYIYFGGKLGGKNGFRRTSSHGKWVELDIASVSTYVSVER